MRIFFTVLFAAVLSFSAYGQNEQAPIVEKALAFKDWTYRTVEGDMELNLRKTAAGKKLVMVVYWAPWCPNWKFDAPFVQGLYEKYKANGFDVIGIAAYDPVSSMKTHIEQNKLTFTSVYETEDRNARLTSKHYQYRTLVGDRR